VLAMSEKLRLLIKAVGTDDLGPLKTD
jgi:hypothetical protein